MNADPMLDSSLNWYPLSPAQRAIWLDAALQEAPDAYQVGTLLSGAALDPELAQAATAKLVAAHEALRLRVDPHEPRQRVALPEEPAPFIASTVPATALAAHLAARAAAGFPLDGRPLFRAELIDAGAAGQTLLLAAHHLVADGIAMARIRRDWIAAYTALAAGTAAALRPSAFLATLPADNTAEPAALTYWRERLAMPPEPLLSGLAASGDVEAAPPFRLDAAGYRALEAAARQAGTTAHRALVALLGIALARRFRRDDLLVGMALHGREADQLDIVGQFARLLPVRIRVEPGQGMAEAVRGAAAALDADLRQPALPLDAIARALGERGGERPHLFDVAITILPADVAEAPRIGGVPLAVRPLPHREHTPLSAYLREQPEGGLEVTIAHDPARLDGAEAGRIAERFHAAIARFVERPAARTATLPRLARGEEARLAGFGEGRRVAVPHAVPMPAFAARRAEAPEALAVIDGAQRLDYAGLDGLSSAFAAAFAARGVGRGDTVAVMIERSLETVAALLGILRLGAVYLPIDPVQPPQRAEAMLRAARARLLLTDLAWAAALGEDIPRLDPAAIDREAAWPHGDAATGPTDPAYVIFTSGSTGTPKGVVVPQGALANLDVARQDHDPIGPGDRVLAAISVGFDVSLGQLLLPLLRGAAIVVAPDLRMMAPSRFWAFLDEHGVTHINSVPSFFEAMLEGAPPHARLRRLMLGGEPLSAPLARRLRAVLNGTPVINMYGPTEACIDAAAYPVPADLASEATSLPIGRPLPNYDLRVLDEAMAPVGIGHIGELFIGGAGLALGYLDAPELTAERFLDTDHGRLYRTGDLAAWREDGELLFLGRVDGQVKIRGHRIERGEIEAQLLAHPGIAQAAVIARPDARGDNRLLAYLVSHEGAAPEQAALAAHLAERLPAYMMPAAFVMLERLPLTTHGKLDQRALPEPAAGAGASPSRAPEGAAERAVAAAFAELLGLDAVDAEADFFRLGGHSLLATRLVARLRETQGAALGIRAVYEAPTVAALARRLDAAGRAASLPPITTRAVYPALLPLSFAQERLWLLDRLDPGSAAYNMPLVFRARGALDLAALERALAQLIARHASLRCEFPPGLEQVVQRVVDAVPTPLQVIELPGAEAATVEAVIAEAALAPFDLAVAPLLRLTLLRLGAAEHIAILVVHHIIADGWSMAVLLEEFGDAYAAARRGEAAALPPLALRYADFALWQREVLEGPELDRQLGFWREALSGAPDLLDLPADAEADGAPGFGGLLPLAIAPALAARVTAAAAALGCSPFILLLGAWGLLLARWCGQADLLIGTALAGRADPRLDRQVGLYVNTLPARLRVDAAPGVADMLRQLAERMLDIHAHQDMPFERLVQALAPHRQAGRHPLIQAFFVLQNGPSPRLALDGVAVEPIALEAAPARFDIALSLAPAAEGFVGEISYATARFTQGSIEALAGRYVALLDEVAALPEVAPASLPTLQGWGRPLAAAPAMAAPMASPAAPEPPRGALEQAMAALWAEVLGTAVGSRTDSFFALGGHSLAALRLIARIEAVMGRQVPVATLFAHQSLAELCAAIDAGETGKPTLLVPLRPGTLPALFCIHPVGGGVFGYAPLAAALPPGPAIFGVQAAGFERAVPLPPTLDAMASTYVEAIRGAQPLGPYHLLGHSFGGLLAFRMAQILEAAGEAVARLILLDTSFPGLEVEGAADPDFLLGIPSAQLPLIENNIRIAAASTVSGRVRRLTYVRADGDGRDAAREAHWLAMAEAGCAAAPMSCGHYAMLDMSEAVGLATRIPAD